jgi:UDP-GlcNAc:undecaprenyl-phosphate/decaprenyl-phosphate GlcNAc-1-phosphate transferase
VSTLLLIAASALFLVVGLVPFVRRLAIRWQIIDKPAARKVHQAPTPRFGGLAMVAAVLVAVILLEDRFRLDQLLSILVGAAWVSVLGGIDDRWGLPPAVKFSGQVVAAGILIVTGVQVRLFVYPWMDWGFTVVWVVGLTNALNFLDNMDGLSGGIAAIASGFFLLMAVQSGQYLVGGLAAALLGASVGFLLYNFKPATIFMGDTGSLFLGFMLAALAIKLRFPANTPSVTWMVPVLVLGLPIFDTSLVVLSRLRRGHSPVLGGKDHTSHRLVQMGFTQREAVMALYLVAGVLGMVANFVAQGTLIEAYLLGGAVLIAALYALWRLEQVPLE